jgi:hypothetical protein
MKKYEEGSIVIIFLVLCTHNKRQATQHGCLPSLLGDRDKGIKNCTMRNKIFCTGPTRAAKAEQKSLVLA